jgi:hypothetical protein
MVKTKRKTRISGKGGTSGELQPVILNETQFYQCIAVGGVLCRCRRFEHKVYGAALVGLFDRLFSRCIGTRTHQLANRVGPLEIRPTQESQRAAQAGSRRVSAPDASNNCLVNNPSFMNEFSMIWRTPSGTPVPGSFMASRQTFWQAIGTGPSADAAVGTMSILSTGLLDGANWISGGRK